MSDVRPLRGVRFDRLVSGPVGPLLAPPYDASGELSRRAEHSIAAIENADLGVAGNQHESAVHRYRAWRSQGILRQDETPAVYVHRHRFELNGTSRLRSGLLVRVRLADWADRVVLPHERTVEAPRLERLERLRAVGANLSPLYFLYRDPTGEIRDLLDTYTAASTVPVERDRMGGTHSLESVAAPELHQALAAVFAERTLFVADGHHRYEAALAYRDENRRRHGLHPDAPWEFVLALLSAVEDPGVHVRPTHRIVTGAGQNFPRDVLDVVRRWFLPREARGSTTPDPDRSFISRVALAAGQGTWDIHARPGNPHLALLPRDKGAAWRSLPVAAVTGILDATSGAPLDQTEIRYAIEADAAMSSVARGESRAAFVLPSPRLDTLLAVAEEGDLLPPKSTWFEPKAPAGLVINEIVSQSARSTSQ